MKGFERVWVNGVLCYTGVGGYTEGVQGVGQIV
jgi:hypothetical protein